jgi:hypothetical protein
MKKTLTIITALALGAFALTAQAGLSLSLCQAEADLNQAWQSLSAEQRQQLKASELRWVRFKDSLGDAEKEDEVRSRAGYLWSLVKAQTRDDAPSAEEAKPAAAEAAPKVDQLPAGFEEALQETWIVRSGFQINNIQCGNTIEARDNRFGIPYGTVLYAVRIYYHYRDNRHDVPNAYHDFYFYKNTFNEWHSIEMGVFNGTGANL